MERACERAGEVETSETIVEHSKGRFFGDPVNVCRPVKAFPTDILTVLLDVVSHMSLWGVAVEAPWVQLGHLC